MTTRERIAAAALAAALAAGLAAATGAGARAAAGEWARTEVSQARLVAAATAAGAAESLRLGLQFQLDPGWKIYWRSPGDAGSPPMPDFSASANAARVDVAWPAPTRFDELADLETAGYEGETVLPLTLRPERPGEAVRVRATVPYQACETICIPYVAELALDLPAGPAAASAFARLIDRYEARVPRAPEAAGVEVLSAAVAGAPPAERIEVALRSPLPFAAPEMFVEAPPRYRAGRAAAAVAADGARARLSAPVEARGGASIAGEAVTITVVDGDRAFEFAAELGPAAPEPAPPGAPALAAILGLALLGGLVLNLMPCVLPVLALKLMGAIGHGGGARGAARAGFLASAAGIVASFLVLAAAAAAVKLAGGAVGWGIQFQQPAFLVFLALVVTLFACNLFGLFEIGLPAWLGGAAARAGGGSLAGHFAAGAFATLLATPCSAPFLGTAVGFALARGPGEIFAVFAALGAGMAAPYLAVAAFPALATRLPRPGPWMVKLRAALGLALAATAVWLVFVLAARTGSAAALAAGAACAALAPALWLARRARWAGAAAAAAAALAAFLAPALAPPPGAAGSAAESAGKAGLWTPFAPAALAAAVAGGKTVFVDVTAEWCVTCKVNKALALDSEPVRARLGAAGTVAMRADWTRPNPEIADYLAGFGRYGIPFNAAYGPGAPEGLALPELLRPGTVLAALDRAAGAVAPGPASGYAGDPRTPEDEG